MQDREISREEALKRLEGGAPFSEIYEPLWEDALALAIKALKDEPVVRCEDCKKYIPCQKLPIGTSKWCDLFDRATCETNYCAWGERREDGND